MSVLRNAAKRYVMALNKLPAELLVDIFAFLIPDSWNEEANLKLLDFRLVSSKRMCDHSSL